MTANYLARSLHAAGPPGGTAGAIRVSHRLHYVLPADPDAVRAVAAPMPAAWVDAYDNAPSSVPPSSEPVGAVARLASTVGVVRLQHLDLVPGLRQPLRAVIDEAAALFTPNEAIEERSSVLYAGSSRSGVDAHVDLHHNLFVHLYGVKRFSVGWFDDWRDQQHAVEMKFGGRGPTPEPDHTAHFDLSPGDALYVPPYTVHWVASETGYTISASCAWSTASTARTETLQRVNTHLRRIGLPRMQPGRLDEVDDLKVRAAPVLDALVATYGRRRLPGSSRKHT